MRSLNQLKAEFARGGSSRALVEQCLSRIADSSGEGGRVFLKVNAAGALSAADYYDHLRAHGAAPSPFAGIPVSIKDLFDVAGEVRPPVRSCCVTRLRPRKMPLASRACAQRDSFRLGEPI